MATICIQQGEYFLDVEQCVVLLAVVIMVGLFLDGVTVQYFMVAVKIAVNI